MKAFILVLVSLFAFQTVDSAFAQFRPEVGVRAGGSFAQMRGEDNVFGEHNTDHKLGLTAGLYTEIPVSRQVSIQPEFLYIQKGGRLNEDFSDGSFSSTLESNFNLDYLELPVLVKYHTPMIGRVTPAIYAGPYAAYTVRRNMSFDLSGDGGDSSMSIDADDIFRRADFGAVMGAELGYRIAARKVNLGVRYDMGLSNIFVDDSDWFEVTKPTARNHDVSVVFGVRLF